MSERRITEREIPLDERPPPSERPSPPEEHRTEPLERLKVTDGAGYIAGSREKKLAGADDDELQRMISRDAPLGHTKEEWDRHRDVLWRALDEDGVGQSDLDIRLKGTSAGFFSRNPEKNFPQNPTEVSEQARKSGGNPERSVAVWREAGYDRAGPKPAKHFRDSRFRLGFGPRSDYDFQISSDEIVRDVEAYAERHGIDRDELISEHGGHYKSEYVYRTHPALAWWAYNMSEHTGRDFSVATFPSEGPRGHEAFDRRDFRVPRPETKQ